MLSARVWMNSLNFHSYEIFPWKTPCSLILFSDFVTILNNQHSETLYSSSNFHAVHNIPIYYRTKDNNKQRNWKKCEQTILVLLFYDYWGFLHVRILFFFVLLDLFNLNSTNVKRSMSKASKYLYLFILNTVLNWVFSKMDKLVYTKFGNEHEK